MDQTSEPGGRGVEEYKETGAVGCEGKVVSRLF